MLDYEKITARDLKRIVNREEATPAAIGLFIAHDIWRRLAEPEGITTNELLRWIEDKWRFKTFANELDYWISLGEFLSRFTIQIDIARVQCALTSLVLRTEILSLEGSLYAAAFSSAHEQAAVEGHKLKLRGLSTSKAKVLATRAAGQSKMRATPKTMVRQIEKQIRSSTGSVLALRDVLQDAAALLDMPGLSREIEAGVEANAKAVVEHRESIAQLSSFAPQWARQLNDITNLENVEPDSIIERELEMRFSVYLTGSWRKWARAGVNLRAIADSSNGIVDLMQHAEESATELTHE